MTTERRTYTVAELIGVLEKLVEGHQVEAYSGCHDCGGPYLDIDLYGEKVQIIGHDRRGDDS